MGGRGSLGGTRSTYRGNSTSLFNQMNNPPTPDTGGSSGGGGGGGGSKKSSSGSASTGGIQTGGGSGKGGGGSADTIEKPKVEEQTTDVDSSNLPPDVDLEAQFQLSPAWEAFDKKYENSSEAVYNQKYQEAFTKWVQSQTPQGGPSGPESNPLDAFRQKDNPLREGQSLIDDIEAVNPRYDVDDPDRTGENTNNCQRCSVTVEFRARGYDVTAVPLTEGWLKSAIRPDGKVRESRARWVDISNLFETADGQKAVWRKFPTKDSNGVLKSKGTQAATLEATLKKQPEGARGVIGLQWERGGAHIFNWEIRNGQVYYIDGQSNIHGSAMFTTPDGGNNFKHNWKTKFDQEFGVRVFRTDDKKPTKDALTWVRERSNEEKNAPTLTELNEWLDEVYDPDELPQYNGEQIAYLREAFFNGWNAVRTGQTPLMPPDYEGTPAEEAWEDGIDWARRPS